MCEWRGIFFPVVSLERPGKLIAYTHILYCGIAAGGGGGGALSDFVSYIFTTNTCNVNGNIGCRFWSLPESYIPPYIILAFFFYY